MSSIVVSGDTSGAVTISAPAVAGTTTLTLPSTSGTVLTTASTTGISGSAISSGTVAEAYGGTGTNTGYYGFKNRIINGAMVIDQRNAGASVTSTSGFNYPVDRFFIIKDSATTGVMTAQQNSSAPAGFTGSVKLTTTTAQASLAATDYVRYSQIIEGYNVADLNFGSANAKTVTLSFWVRSSLTGTFGGSLGNSAWNRTYPFTYSISVADTWEQKAITIAGDTSGTWLTDNGKGLRVDFGLGVGSTYSGTAGAWASSLYISATGATSVVGTNAATWYITGVQLEKGSTATSFDYRPYSTELALCQRYYAKLGAGGFSNYAAVAVGFASNSTTVEGIISYPVPMRSAATLSFSNVRTNTAVGTNSAVTSISNTYAGLSSLNAVFVSSGSILTQGQGATIITNNNSSGYIDLSAEL
jgi:hypothetical protein